MAFFKSTFTQSFKTKKKYFHNYLLNFRMVINFYIVLHHNTTTNKMFQNQLHHLHTCTQARWI